MADTTATMTTMVMLNNALAEVFKTLNFATALQTTQQSTCIWMSNKVAATAAVAATNLTF
eukprot:1639048-Ditylum_brightwellii.AAC.1